MNEQALGRVVDEAAYWMMRLQSGEAGEEERLACERWQASDPRNAAVFQRMAANLGSLQWAPLQGLSEQQVLSAINTPSSRRAFLRGSLGALAAVGLGALATRVGLYGFALPGDLYTGVGERRTHQLADGSSLTLDAQTRVRPDGARSLRLYSGTVLLDVQPRAERFQLETQVGSLSTAGGQLSLRSLADGQLQVAAIGAQVRLIDGQVLEAGHSARLAAGRVVRTGLVAPSDSAWVDGLLEVDDQPLADVVEALRAYHHGVLQVSAEAARLRTSGLFPLDDSDRALRLLARTLPIDVRRFSDYWVRIDVA